MERLREDYVDGERFYDDDLNLICHNVNELDDIKQEKLIAGDGIEISGNTISVTGGTGGAVIDDTVIATDKTWSSIKINTELANIPQLEAGQNIEVADNKIAAKGYVYDSTKNSFAYGYNPTASGTNSHAEGYETTASGTNSHAEGSFTIAQNTAEHAEGIYNNSHMTTTIFGDAGNTAHSIGIGISGIHKNAFEIMQNGDMYVLGLGGYQGTDTKVQDATIKTLQEVIDTKQDKEIPEPLCFTALETGVTIGIVNDAGNFENTPNIEYSTDNKSTWATWDYSDISLDDAEGGKVYLRGMNQGGFSESYSKYSKFTIVVQESPRVSTVG